MIVSAVFTRAVAGKPAIKAYIDTERTVDTPVYVVGVHSPGNDLTVCLDREDAVRLFTALAESLAPRAAA